jgi:flagellar protein FliO/FliZ
MFRLLTIALIAPTAFAAEAPKFAATPSVTVSILRMLGSLVFVAGLFLIAAWVFKNGFRLKGMAGAPRKLQVLEARSLGPRQAVYVVGYESQRMLIGSTPNGLSLLSHLPEGTPIQENERIVPVSFREALFQALGRK